MSGTISNPPFLTISLSQLVALLVPLTPFVSSFNTRQGSVTLSSADVTGALGFTPYNAANPSSYVNAAGAAAAAPVQSVFGRAGTVVLTSSDITTALGFTPLSNAGGALSGALTLNAGGVIAAGQTLTNNGTISGGTVAAKIVLNTATLTATGSTQGAAAVLTAQRTIVTGGSGLAIKVPATAVGEGWEIWNRSGGDILAFPDSSAQFESLAVNAAVTLSNNDKVTAVYTTSIQGYIG